MPATTLPYIGGTPAQQIPVNAQNYQKSVDVWGAEGVLMTRPIRPTQSSDEGAPLNHLRIVQRSPSSGGADPAGAALSVGQDPCLEAYQRELDYLLRTLERLSGRSPEVEDMAQEVFLVLRRTWRDYDQSRPLKPFLFGIAFRVASSHRRRFWREIPYAVVESEDLAPSPDREVEASQARAIVLAALQKIPLPRRAVLVMHDLDHTSMQDIASALSIPLFTAYSRLRKARLELEQAILDMQRKRAVR
jgi:RNA polymerase sigma-70 factor, ECF subfamily